MARKMTEWPSKRGPITKIMPSDGCIGDTVPLAVGKWYDFHEFGWYMGNVGLAKDHFRKIPVPCASAVLIASVITIRSPIIFKNGSGKSTMKLSLSISLAASLCSEWISHVLTTFVRHLKCNEISGQSSALLTKYFFLLFARTNFSYFDHSYSRNRIPMYLSQNARTLKDKADKAFKISIFQKSTRNLEVPILTQSFLLNATDYVCHLPSGRPSS